MTLKIVGIVASLSAAALTLSAGETSARTAGGGRAAVPFVRPGVPLVRPVVPPGTRPFLAHHRRNFIGGLWPAGGYYYGGAPYGEPMADSTLPASNEITYTYKQDVPWDWAHRYPPAVAPSDRAYVPACSSEPVTVPGRGGEQTVNVIRCY
jgi:hypothetical protein